MPSDKSRHGDHNDKKKHMLPENNHVPIQTLEHDHAETPPVTRERVSVPWRRKENPSVSVMMSHQHSSVIKSQNQNKNRNGKRNGNLNWRFGIRKRSRFGTGIGVMDKGDMLAGGKGRDVPRMTSGDTSKRERREYVARRRESEGWKDAIGM